MFVSGDEIRVQGDSVGNEFHEARASGEGEHFVGSDAEIAEACGGVVFEEARDLVENLFHYRVLPEVIVA